MLTNMEQQASILKVATEYENQNGRKTDDKQSFVNAYFVSISNSIDSKIRSMNKLTKYLDIPRSVRYDLCSKYNLIQGDLINKKTMLNDRR